MYTNTTKTDFMDTMQAVRPGSFTYDGLDALFDGLEAMEDDMGEQIEFSPVTICCQFSEYPSAIDALLDLGGDLEAAARTLLENEEQETAEENALDLLRDETLVFECDGGAVVIDSEF